MQHSKVAIIVAAASMSLATAGAQPSVPPRQAIQQAIPGTRTRLIFVPIPGGRVTPIPGGRVARSAEADGLQQDVAPFWMSSTEIPWEIYDIYAFALDSSSEEANGAVDAVSRPTKPYGAADRGFGHDGYAALGMTYGAAVGFASWLSLIAGRSYRLPTDAEWTLACSAQRDLPLQRVAWTWDTAFDGPQAVGSKEPSPLGLYDLLGNVAEWVSNDGQPPSVRGGSFRDENLKVNCDARQFQAPGWNERDPQIPKSHWWLSDAPFVGFRLVTVQE